MAGCYHDTQDFKSDLKIEVARECDMLEADQNLKDIKCDKNPGHHDFIPFKDLTLQHLPNEIRNRDTLERINKIGSRVVRLQVPVIINGKRTNRIKWGYGSVKKIDNEYLIRTNNHVVKTNDDVKNCTVEFHYDDKDSSDVLRKGVGPVTTNVYRDISFFKFQPVPAFLHQQDLSDDGLPRIVIIYKNDKIETEVLVGSISCKCHLVSYCDLNSSLIYFMFLLYHDGSYSYFKSSCFKFQPIPLNRQVELTSIEIHIDEDDGKRVIQGKVVKFGDEFVVEISESIFQDEVKKCRLVWNGEIIGRGTRLYFKPVQSSEIYSGIDLEQFLNNGLDYFWIYDYHPISSGIKGRLDGQSVPDNTCCVGHPHDGIKMVTFGRALEVTLERFDNQYRRITQPNPDCQCKEVGCMRYTCKTCPGSSGSPVFELSEGLSSSHSHFMGERIERVLPNGELIENINMAWCPVSRNTI